MPWIRLPGITGRVYVPKAPPGSKRKHNCKDCYWCQMCTDSRCEACRRERRGAKPCRRKKHKK